MDPNVPVVTQSGKEDNAKSVIQQTDPDGSSAAAAAAATTQQQQQQQQPKSAAAPAVKPTRPTVAAVPVVAVTNTGGRSSAGDGGNDRVSKEPPSSSRGPQQNNSQQPSATVNKDNNSSHNNNNNNNNNNRNRNIDSSTQNKSHWQQAAPPPATTTATTTATAQVQLARQAAQVALQLPRHIQIQRPQQQNQQQQQQLQRQSHHATNSQSGPNNNNSNNNHRMTYRTTPQPQGYGRPAYSSQQQQQQQQQQQRQGATARTTDARIPAQQHHQHHQQQQQQQQQQQRYHAPQSPASRAAQQERYQQLHQQRVPSRQAPTTTTTTTTTTSRPALTQGASQPRNNNTAVGGLSRVATNPSAVAKNPTTTTTVQTQQRPHHFQQQQQQPSSLQQPSHVPPPPPPLPPTLEQTQRAMTEEKIAKERSVLVDKYAPYIAPSDTSLNEARQRLQTALEQTRKLRTAFTDRVYGKYRVCLQPPESAEEIIARVMANPKEAHRRLEQENQQIKQEKDLEKKEAQSLNAELSKMDVSTLSVSADNAEQLMYLSAGLSLVILPEENMDPELLERYPERGPVNHATGQRVRSISQAAAAAGEVILERSRKGAAMRKQWQQQGKIPLGDPGKSTATLAATTTTTNNNNNNNNTPMEPHKPLPSTIDVLKAPSKTPVIAFSKVKGTGGKTGGKNLAAGTNAAAQTNARATISGEKNLAKQGIPESTTSSMVIKRPASKMSKILNSEASSAKIGKSRGGAGISVNISLSLSPTADELSLDPDRACRASTRALMTNCVGTAQGISRATPQQRLKHPHPESSGGRQRSSSATSARKELATLVQNAVATANGFGGGYAHTYLNLALPPLPTPMERRDYKPLIILDKTRAASNARSTRAIRSVLERLEASDARPTDTAPASQATKIGVLRSIQKARAAEATQRAGTPSLAERRIDPSLAFSVLQAIGLVTEAGNNRNETYPAQMDAKVARLNTRKRKLSALTSLEAKWGKIGLSKRARFSVSIDQNKRLVAKRAPSTSTATAAAAVATTPAPARPQAPVQSIRGGGEMLSTSTSDSATPGSVQGLSETAARKTDSQPPARNGSYGNQQNNYQHQQAFAARQSLGMMHTTGIASGDNVQGNNNVSAQAPNHTGQALDGNNEGFQQQESFNAIQLAQQLRISGNGMSGRANFTGVFPNAAGWSSNGSQAGAMATTQSSLAAMGFHQLPLAGFNSVQDRARALMAREQQNVAAAHAVAVHQQTLARSPFLSGAANPGFAPTSTGVPSLNTSSGTTSQNQQQLRDLRQSATTAHQQVMASDAGNQNRSAVPSATKGEKRKVEDTAEKECLAAATQPALNSAATKKQKVDPLNVKAPAETAAQPARTTTSAPQGPINGTARTKKEGMQFYLPTPPASISPNDARLIQTGQVHTFLEEVGPTANTPDILKYLNVVGSSVPIPKAFVASLLKDRLNIPGFKHLASCAGFAIPRETIVSVILVWLWNYHEDEFQVAFTKSGRIDVDPTCKWLVQAAVDASIRALTAHICKKGMVAVIKNDSSAKSAVPQTDVNVDLVAASVIGKALTTVSQKSSEVDFVLPQFHHLTSFLDDVRICALQLRAQERVLLANLLSLKSVMSESFAHAYVSSMVRAGDALDHDNLAQIVSDDDLKISSLLPYDILKDETGAWEDPCRPVKGYTPNLTGDVLTKIAHARAMIQKSMRRLQDRHNIKSGTPTSGAYTDMLGGTGPNGATTFANSGSKTPTSGSSTPRSWNKRKGSVSAGPIVSGTGSSNATSWSLYEPKHFCEPIDWTPSNAANSPYGRYTSASRQRIKPGPPAKGEVKPTSLSIDIKTIDSVSGDQVGPCIRGTHEIAWESVAGSFHAVAVKGMGGSSPHANAAPVEKPSFSTQTIISPFCRELTASPVASDSEESDTEEDLSHEAVLGRHQVVLDEMASRLTAFMEARKRLQEKKKKRA